MTYKLSTINILIKNRHLKRLLQDVWNDRPVPAKLEYNEKVYDVKLVFRGDHTREFAKKSYHIIFPKFIKEFNGTEIHLNAEFCDPSLIRNKLSFDFFQLIGCASPNSKHVFLYVNGKPKGVYLQIESVDESFLKARNYPVGPIIYAINYHANFSLLTESGDVKSSLLKGYEIKCGSEKDEKELESFLALVNTLPREQFAEEIKQHLNVKNYLLWLCGIVCTQNFDGFVHNYALYKNVETNLYEIIPWDYDATWGRDWEGELMDYNEVPIEGFNTLTARLLDIDEIRLQYKNLLEDVLLNHFTFEAIRPMIAELYEGIRPFLQLDPYKSKKAIQIFEEEPMIIEKFISSRKEYLMERLDRLKG